MEKLSLKELNSKYQRDFKQRKKELDPDEFKKQRTEEMRVYRAKRNAREALLNPKTPKQTEPKKTIELEPILPVPKRKVKGRPKKVEKDEIIPLYKRTNKKLEQNSIDDYMSKINIINELMMKKPLASQTKTQIIKALEGKQFYTSVIEASMRYLKTIEEVVQKLREKYQNDNTFRGYINVLVVILGKLPTYKKEYQQLAKVNIKLSEEYTDERKKNILKDEDKDKIISFSSEEIEGNIEKLPNINDKMVYVLSVYLLRRLEIRTLILSLKDDGEDENYMIVDENNNPTEVIFNKYKTAKTFKKQQMDIPDNIKGIIKEYLDKNKIRINEFVFGQIKDRRQSIGQGNFSNKIKTVFNKLYDADITNRWIRQSYITQKSGNILKDIEEFEADAKLLSHSTEIHKQYIRNKK